MNAKSRQINSVKKRNERLKKLVSIILILTLTLTILPAQKAGAASGLKLYNYTTQSESNYTGSQIKVTFKSKKISSDLTPGISLNGVEFVSYYDIFSKSRIDADCVFNKAKGTITIQKNKKTVILTLGSNIAKVNGKKITIPEAPVMLRFKQAKMTKIFVPAQFITEALGYIYTYNSSKNEIIIDKKTILLSYNSGSRFEYAGTQGKVTVDSKKAGADSMPSIMVNNISMLLAQNVFADSNIGASYKYNEKKRTITLSKKGIVIEMTIGSKTAYVNGVKKTLTAAPLNVTNYDTGNTYVMVPGYFTATNLGYDYYWNKEKKTSQISTRKKNPAKVAPIPTPIPAADLYGNTSGNLNQDGKFVSRDGWLYTNTIDNGFLYKFKSDGSQKTMMEVYNATNLNISGDYIYYLSTVQDGSLFRINLDGTHNRLINNSDYITQFILYDKYIFYVNYDDGRKIYRMNLDGSGRKKLTEDKNCDHLNITKSYVIYTTQGGGVVRINLDGTGRLKLSSLNADDLVIDEENAYFIYTGYKRNLYKVNFDGIGQTKLNDDNAYSLNISGNVLYYQNMDDGNKLYAIRTDGKARTKILDASTNFPSIADGYLYYLTDEAYWNDELHRVKLTELKEDTITANTAGNLTGNIINGAFTAYNSTNIYMSNWDLFQMPVEYTDKTPFDKYKYNGYYSGIHGINVVGDYLYYTLSAPSNPSIGGIYKVKTDRTQVPVELSTSKASYMTVMGNWIYFTQQATDNRYTGSGPIFKMKTDGTGLAAVNARNAGYGRALNIVGNYIYYINDSDGSSIYRMRLDGGAVQRLSTEGDISSIIVYGDNIYYNSFKHKSLMMMPITGGAGTSILPSVSRQLIVYLDRIYYIEANAIYSCKLDGTEATLVVDGVLSDAFNITAGYLYYRDNSPNQNITRTKLHDILSGDPGTSQPEITPQPTVTPVPTGETPQKTIREIYLEQGGLMVDHRTDINTYYHSTNVHEINPDVTPQGEPGWIRFFDTVPYEYLQNSMYEYTQNKKNIETFKFTANTPFQSVTSEYLPEEKLLTMTVKNMNFVMEPENDIYMSMSNLAEKIYYSFDKNTGNTTIKLSMLPDKFTYDLKLSEDGKSLYLSVYLNALTEVTFRTEEAYDTLTLTGINPLDVLIQKDEENPVLRIALPYTADGVGYFSEFIEGSLAFDVLSVLNDYENTKVVLAAVDEMYYDYEVFTEGNQVMIKLHRLK